VVASDNTDERVIESRHHLRGFDDAQSGDGPEATAAEIRGSRRARNRDHGRSGMRL